MSISATDMNSISSNNTLSGNDSSGIRIGAGLSTNYIAQNTTWRNFNIPYLIGCNLYVDNPIDPVFTIAPGCSLKFGNSMGLLIAYNNPGGLVAEGTVDSPIVFTGIAKLAGAWDGITLDPDADDAQCRLTHCFIQYGGANSKGNIYCNQASPNISDCSIGGSSTYGIYVSRTGSVPVVTNITYSPANTSGNYYKEP